MWPVILRELRAESRRPFTYWLRVIGAIAVLGAIIFTVRQPGRWASSFSGGATFVPSQQIMGRLLFGNVNAVLFGLIWLLVPLLTADCINRERREGTLGLLFLTPLTAHGIVIGKSLAHSLRALTFVLTMLPVLAVPLLVGGVDPKDLIMASLLDFSALLLALAAGLLASSWTRQWIYALLLAELLSFVFALLLMHAHSAFFQAIVNAFPKFAGTIGASRPGTYRMSGFTWMSSYHHGGFFNSLAGAFGFNTSSDMEVTSAWFAGTVAPRFSPGSSWSAMWTSGSAALVRQWFVAAGFLLAASCAFLGTAILLAARGIRRSWRLQAPTARAERIERRFFQPRYLPSLFRRKMSRSLDRNPIGWLHQYSAAARLTKWGWCLFVVVVESLLTCNLNDLDVGQGFVFGVLLLAMTFTAAGSFRRERETGALELLLVTPLRVWQIIAGRVGGIWRQFLPATVLAVMAAFYVSTFNWRGVSERQMEESLTGFFLLLSSYVAIPVIGLYWSMQRRNFLFAWIAVALTALVVPWGVAWASIQRAPEMDSVSPTLGFVGSQLTIAAVCGAGLLRNLSARRFVIVS